MKQILMIVAVVAAFGINAMAQDHGDFRWGIAIDAGASKYLDGENASAFSTGLKGDYGISDRVFINAALGYASKKNDNMKVSYITLPVHIGWNFVKGDNVCAFAEVGPYFNFNVSGDKTTGVRGSSVKSKGFEMGLGLGLGCEFVKHLRAGIFYNLGYPVGAIISTIGSADNDVDIRIQYFGLGLAYMF